MTLTLSGLYKDFFSLGQGLFEMVGAIHKVKVKPADIESLKEGMLTMPAHADVKKGLEQLKDAGFPDGDPDELAT
jgi:2-haloacid dehalogenase